MSQIDKLALFSERASALHLRYYTKIKVLEKKIQDLYEKYPVVNRVFRKPENDYMSSTDYGLLRALKAEQTYFEGEVKKLIFDVMQEFHFGDKTDWEKLPSIGDEESPPEENTKGYEVSLGHNYSLMVEWSYFAEDYSDNLSSFRESYTAMILGEMYFVERKGFLGFGRRVVNSLFPSVVIEVKQMEYKQEFIPRDDAERDLLDLGRRLRENLG